MSTNLKPILLQFTTAMLIILPYGAARASSASESVVPITVEVTPQPLNRFIPARALGAGVDGQEKDDIASIYTPANTRAMLSAGLGALSYRLRTELGCEAWHWNPQGSWSDPGRQQGYWISSTNAAAPILVCNGYRLPRRGNTIDQAENNGYSRLDDGNLQTFWKSNPYLDQYFTGEANALHPQWVIVDLGIKQPINRMTIHWGVPFATRYQLSYWRGSDDAGENTEGSWQTFPGGTVKNGRGGDVSLSVAPVPIPVRFVRLTMTEASGKAPAGSTDVRDGLGYAIREISLGTPDHQGTLHDRVRHGASKSTQTLMFVSSTDPWHRASDRDVNVEQPGLDLVFQSGLTHHLPMLTPVSLLYGPPENAVNEVQYLKNRGYPIERIELGEEPDGQYIDSQDYAALYLQWTKALRKVEPSLQFGGPSLQDADVDFVQWPEPPQRRLWLGRVIDSLIQHHRATDFNFVSLEWYPFDDVCSPSGPKIVQAPALLSAALNRVQKSVFPLRVPWLITEYGYSAAGAEAEVDLAGALFNADVIGQFLTLGGSTAYLYGYEPNILIHESDCRNPEQSWGNNMLFLADDEHHVRYKMPTYYAASLLTHEWVSPGGGEHQLYRAEVPTRDSKEGTTANPVHNSKGALSADPVYNSKGQPLITAYALHRPDGLWSLLILNKDPQHSHNIQIRLESTQNAELPNIHTHTLTHAFTSTHPSTHPPVHPSTHPSTHPPFSLHHVTWFQYSPAQYRWHPAKDHGFPQRDLPPVVHQEPASNPVVQLPPMSITILKGFSSPG